MMRGKCDTTQNISCSISFFSTFRGNFDFFLDSVHTVQYSSSLGQHLSQITAAHYTVKPNLFQSRETIPSQWSRIFSISRDYPFRRDRYIKTIAHNSELGKIEEWSCGGGEIVLPYCTSVRPLNTYGGLYFELIYIFDRTKKSKSGICYTVCPN